MIDSIFTQSGLQSNTNNQDSKIDDQNELSSSILNFAENIVNNSSELDTDFAKTIDDNIADLLA